MMKKKSLILWLGLIASSAQAMTINVFNFRTVTHPTAVTASQQTYVNFFNQVNSKEDKYKFFSEINNKPNYDFIGLEAYPYGQRDPNDNNKNEKDKISLAVSPSKDTFTLIGNGRSNGSDEATPIMFNNQKWKNISSSVQDEIYKNCEKVTSQSGHTAQNQTCHLGTYTGGYGTFPRIATWSVFQNLDTSEKIIYVVAHFPIAGSDPQQGGDFAKNIYAAIINPLRKDFQDTPVVFSADFNTGNPDTFDQQYLSPYAQGLTIASPDNMIKIHTIPSYNQEVKFITNSSQLVSTGGYECGNTGTPNCITDHHPYMIEATLTTSTGPGPVKTCDAPMMPTVIGQDGDAMTITWDKVDNATSYNVYGYPGLTNEIKDKVEGFEYVDDSTKGKSGPFDYYVQANCGNTQSDLSPVNHYQPTTN